MDGSISGSLPVYYYAGRFLPRPETVPVHFLSLNAAQQDLVLLTRFWTCYPCPDTPNVLQKAPLAIYEGLTGQFLFSDKPLKKPVSFILSKGASSELAVTDSTGAFRLPYTSLYASSNQLLTLCPVSSGKYGYIHAFSSHTNIGLIDTLNQVLAGAPFASNQNTFEPDAEQDSSSSPLKKKGYQVLKEVEVKARRPDIITYLKKAYDKVGDDIYIGDCRYDYVCVFDEYINCPEHAGFKPIDGNYYFNPHPPVPGRAYGWVKYIGCPDTTTGKFMATLKATWRSKEFYVKDYNSEPPGEEQFSTTLYWAYELTTDARGEARFRFFSNNLTGKFLIHAEGLGNSGPLSGTCTYKVKDKGAAH